MSRRLLPCVVLALVSAVMKSSILRSCHVNAWMASQPQRQWQRQRQRQHQIIMRLSSQSRWMIPTASTTGRSLAAAERRGMQRLLSFSLSSSVQQDQDQEQDLTSSTSLSSKDPKDDTTVHSPNVVVVKRNRQSLEFRKGSQLVFEGAIAYTSGTPLQMGDLVQVWVEAPAASDGSADGGSADKAKYSKSKTKKKPNGGSSKQQKSGIAATTPIYPHFGPNDDAPNKPNQLIGWGVYNPSSLYRVRILCHANLDIALTRTLKTETTTAGVTPINSILRHKLVAAMATRTALGLPSLTTDGRVTTNAYRLVNGEGDGLSGLAIDVLHDHVVIMSSAAWCEAYQTQIIALVEELTSSRHVLWKTTASRLKQDGWEVRRKEEMDSTEESSSIHQDAATPVIIQENGVLYRTYPFQDGQKTGVYCDQRDNKYNLAKLCQGKTVLDLCCYHGGFSFTAKLLGGAKHCTGVDSSQDAIDVCNENAQLNGIAKQDIEFVRDDVDNFMKLAASDESSRFWDVIVLDPPKLAPSVSGLDRAARKYHSLNRDALKLINPTDGGLFLTCTCSAAMTQKDGGQLFLQTVQEAALSARRRITLLRTSGAAACHTTSPASYPAGAYLTAALFHVAAKE